MPKIKYLDRLPPIPLTVPQLRVLGELAEGGFSTRKSIEERAGAAGLLGLQSLGYVIEEAMDVDGRAERNWRITEIGRAAVAKAAMPAKLVGRNGEQSRLSAAGPLITCLAPWYGTSRRIAAAVGEALRGCAWVGVPFCGGLSEVPAMFTAGVNAVSLNDKHLHLINLAQVAAHPMLGAELYRGLRRKPFTESVLRAAQEWCQNNDPRHALDLPAAGNYWIAAWMGRSAESGKVREFAAGLAIRWGAGGGNSALRWANACKSLPAWRTILARCTMTCIDGFEFLARANDRDDGGVYCDPPWPGPGDLYLHKFSSTDHKRLAESLGRFRRARVVLRTGGDELSRSLYRVEDGWDWRESAGRSQSNDVSAEYLVIRNGGRP